MKLKYLGLALLFASGLTSLQAQPWDYDQGDRVTEPLDGDEDVVDETIEGAGDVVSDVGRAIGNVIQLWVIYKLERQTHEIWLLRHDNWDGSLGR